MKYLNIKKALTAWQNLQPLSEKDRERLSRRFTAVSYTHLTKNMKIIAANQIFAT